VTDQNAQESQILLSGLTPRTTYTVMITSTRDDEMSDAAEATFTTCKHIFANFNIYF